MKNRKSVHFSFLSVLAVLALCGAGRSASALTADRAQILKLAEEQKGKDYVWNTDGPDTFDCSGFVHYILVTVLGPQRFPLPYTVYGQNGKALPTSKFFRDTLSKAGARLASCSLAHPADIIFFPASKITGISHIGLISDPARSVFITAQSSKVGVEPQSYGPKSYWSTRSPECYRNIWADSKAQ